MNVNSGLGRVLGSRTAMLVVLATLVPVMPLGAWLLARASGWVLDGAEVNMLGTMTMALAGVGGVGVVGYAGRRGVQDYSHRSPAEPAPAAPTEPTRPTPVSFDDEGPEAP